MSANWTEAPAASSESHMLDWSSTTPYFVIDQARIPGAWSFSLVVSLKINLDSQASLRLTIRQQTFCYIYIYMHKFAYIHVDTYIYTVYIYIYIAHAGKTCKKLRIMVC